jgi:hypothetical protein
MKLRLLTLSILIISLCLALSATSCSNPGPKIKLPKFLEIKVSISGIKDKTDLVITHIYNTDNTDTGELKWNKAGNGPYETYEIGIKDPIEGHVYTIIAEAHGYTIQPESYKIRIIDDKAYFVSNNETGKEALHLDFQFVPENP